jgi:hypothetical protein
MYGGGWSWLVVAVELTYVTDSTHKRSNASRSSRWNLRTFSK